MHKPLIVRDARQVGKTSLIRYFGEKYFENMVEINLEKKTHREIFEGVKSVEDLEDRINLGLDKTIVSGKTLIFIDEIQELQEMMELLRFLAEERKDWHILVAGSLLEVKLAKDWRIPVGRVEYRYLYPLTFFEYLEAMGKKVMLKQLKSIDLGEEIVAKTVAEKEFRRYVLLGGMPEVIEDFAKHRDYQRVREILVRIQVTYSEDIGKYLKSEEERKYLETVVDEGPKIAGSIFRYEGFGGSVYRSREMVSAVRKIEKAMLCTQLLAVNSTVLPMVTKYKRPKKLIWLDCGIVNMVNNAYSELIKGVYGGRLMEQVVGQTLLSCMSDGMVKLAYFAKDRDKGSAEVDFCFPWKEYLVGVEVKSGKIVKSRSLTRMTKEGEGRVVPVVVSWNKLEVVKGVLYIPLYLVERWEDWVGSGDL